MTSFAEYKKHKLEQAEFRAEYEALNPIYEVIRQTIAERTLQQLTQKDLAERAGMKQSNISRFESGNYNPSVEFLQKMAHALGKELVIQFR